jgi:hypothetical protein
VRKARARLGRPARAQRLHRSADTAYALPRRRRQCRQGDSRSPSLVLSRARSSDGAEARAAPFRRKGQRAPRLCSAAPTTRLRKWRVSASVLSRPDGLPRPRLCSARTTAWHVALPRVVRRGASPSCAETPCCLPKQPRSFGRRRIAAAAPIRPTEQRRDARTGAPRQLLCPRSRSFTLSSLVVVRADCAGLDERDVRFHARVTVAEEDHVELSSGVGL